MKLKSDILRECGVEYTDLISSSTMGGIETAMDRHATQVCKMYKKNADEMAETCLRVTENIDNFACGFLVWALFDPVAQVLIKSNTPPAIILDRYKDRPYIDQDTSKQ